jgi:hypothetical protein
MSRQQGACGTRATSTTIQYFRPNIELVAHYLCDGGGKSSSNIIGQFVAFSPDPDNPTWFDKCQVPFDTNRGIGDWVKSDTGDNITVLPAVAVTSQEQRTLEMASTSEVGRERKPI